jgi:acyl carrier protein
MREEIEKEIRNFIIEEVLEETDNQDLPEDIPLLSGVLDSFGLMSLLSFLEDRYDLVINNNQVVAQNFESIQALTIFVESKLVEKEAGVAASA